MHGPTEDITRSPRIDAMGDLLSLIASGNARTRQDLVEKTGLSRSTVTEQLLSLIRGNFVVEQAEVQSARGRPSRLLDVNPAFAMALVADVGEQHTHLAVTDLNARILAETRDLLDIHRGPGFALDWIINGFQGLLESMGRGLQDVLGICLGIPALIDVETKRIVAPSVMTGWADFDISAWFASRTTVPALVENEVNLMAISEHHRYWRDVRHLFFVKAGTGIGSGIIAGGEIYRGFRGAAGEIAHIQVDAAGGPLCRCGKLGCLEARASGWAIARDLRSLGIQASGARDIVDLVRAGRPEAIQLLREAGRIIGRIVSDIGCILNPAAIVLGGTLSRADEFLMAGLREAVYQRSLPLVTRDLVIETAKADLDSCVLMGAAQMVVSTQLGKDCAGNTVRRFANAA